jgi:N-acetylmuramoyl-L-alanine amidase
MNILKKAGVMAVGILLSLSIYTVAASAADYTITQNDTLYKIGILFNTPVSILKTDNKLTSDNIYPGQVLNVPAELYSIKSGDSLYLISKRYNVDLNAIRKANNKWDNNLIPGIKLILPGIKPISGAIINYTIDEVDLLARLITAEATGQPYDAMVAIGGVVVNRVQSKEWPNTITNVIYHVAGGYYQFTPVKNGYINNPASDTAIRAARVAIAGQDSSKGAMFYFDDSSTNQWLWSKPITVQIGRMVFVK